MEKITALDVCDSFWKNYEQISESGMTIDDSELKTLIEKTIQKYTKDNVDSFEWIDVINQFKQNNNNKIATLLAYNVKKYFDKEIPEYKERYLNGSDGSHTSDDFDKFCEEDEYLLYMKDQINDMNEVLHQRDNLAR